MVAQVADLQEFPDGKQSWVVKADAPMEHGLSDHLPATPVEEDVIGVAAARRSGKEPTLAHLPGSLVFQG